MSASTLVTRPLSDAGFHAAPHGRIERTLDVRRPDYATAPIELGFEVAWDPASVTVAFSRL